MLPGRSQRNREPSARRATAQQQRAPVFSYYAGQRRRGHVDGASSDRASRQQADRSVSRARSALNGHQFAWRYIPTYLACLVFVCAFVYVLLLSSDPRVVIEQQPGIVQRDASVYESGVRAEWNKSFRNRTKFTTSTTQTRQEILDNYPELSDVRVQLPLVGRRATIVLVPAAPALQIQAQNGVFYVDVHGKALVDTSHVERVDSVPTVQDDTVLTVDPGKTVLPQSQVAYIVQLVTELKAADLEVQSLTLSDTSANQLDIRLTGQKYYIKTQMETDSDVRQVVGAYLATSKKLESDGIRPGEYIDVRIPDKVFYK